MDKHLKIFAVGVICTIFVLSMHQGCSGPAEKFSKKEETKEIKKVKDLKNNAVNAFKLEQKSR